ncbi:MAG: DUF6544 family protein [Bacteroidota bacterium]|nr:DUF6544 family protein [Bacteroidota bacterium]
MKVLLIIICLIVVGIGLALLIGNILWKRSTSKLVDQLIASCEPFNGAVYNPEILKGLPPPVQRYFRLVLKDGQPLIRSASLYQTGEFNMGESKGGWLPFQAAQHFTASGPGFVWDARISMMPLVSVGVRDGYVNGQGGMQAKILALIPVLNEGGKTELNESALQRYLAEAAWIPTALLPGQGVQWSEIDDNSALATLTDSGITVSLEFKFNEIGEITEVYTPGRYREVNGEYEQTPWSGVFRKYEDRHGIRIPLEGEVEWHLPEGSLPYWKGQITEIQYDFGG